MEGFKQVSTLICFLKNHLACSVGIGFLRGKWLADELGSYFEFS